MTAAQKAWCDDWCRKHSRTWQTFSRKQWKYQFKGKVLVRFVDEVIMREDESVLLLEYLTSSDCIATLSLYDQSVSAEWTPVSAWMEIQQRQNGAMHAVRLYHGLNTDPSNAADGPYLTEDGCMYKVSLTYYWHQPSVISVPPSTSGVAYRIVNLSRDDEDGHYTYALEKRERVQQDVALYLQETDAETDRSQEAHLGVRAGVSAGQEASCDGAGKKVRKTIRKNEDCTIDLINDVTLDKPVQEKVVEIDVSLHGATRTVTDINQSSAALTSNLAIGDRVRNEKTPTGLWNRTVSEIISSFSGWLRGTCRHTIFRHTHVEITAQGTDPGFTHSEEAGGGVIHEKDVQRTEKGWDVQHTTITDKPVARSMERVEKTISGIRKTTVNSNQPSRASTDNLGIGGSVTNEETESGVFNQTIVEGGAEDIGKVAESCDKNAHLHSHSESRVTKDDPGMTHAVDVDNGTIKSVSVQRTEMGGYRKTEEMKVAKPTTDHIEYGTTSRAVKEDHFRNADAIQDGVPAVNVEVEVSKNTNDFAKLDGTRRTVTFTPEKRVSKYGNALYDTEVVVKDNEAEDQNPVCDQQVGVVREASSNPNGHGSASVHITTRTAKPMLRTYEWESCVGNDPYYEYRFKRVIFRNQNEPPELDEPGTYQTLDPSVSINEFGLWDGVYTYQTLLGVKRSNGDSDKYNANVPDPWDNRSQIPNVTEYKWLWNRKRGKFALMKRTLTVTLRVLHSSVKNCADEVKKNPGVRGANGGWLYKSEHNENSTYAHIYMTDRAEQGDENWTFVEWVEAGPS